MRKHLNIPRTIIFICTSCICLSCEKASEDPLPPVIPNQYVELRILEDKTNKPIANAEVRLEKCANRDPIFGCTSYSTVYVLTTNSEGKYKFSTNLSFNRITAIHPNYWQGSSFSRTDINLIPEAYSKVHLKRRGSYSAGNIMSIYVSRPDVFEMYPKDLKLGIPTDTTIYLRSYGNYENVVEWAIGKWAPVIQIEWEGKTSPVFIKPFDTTAVEINF